MNRRARIALCVTCWSLTATSVAAEPSKAPWVLVPVSDVGLPVARADVLTGPLEAALVAAGEPVITNAEAATRIQSRSAESAELDDAALAALKGKLKRAQSALATRTNSQPRILQDMAVEERDALARDPGTAQQLEALCLTLLEYELRDAGAGALAQARFCRELFPALHPDPAFYPQNVVAAFEQSPRKSVRVEGPAGCNVIVNGRDVGAAPRTLSVFPVAARLQLRCAGHETRVHAVRLGEQERISIDPALDKALHTDHGLYLTDGATPLAAVRQLLGARVLILYTQILDGRIRVQLAAASATAPNARRTLWYELLRGYTEDVAAVVEELLHGPNARALHPATVAATAGPGPAQNSKPAPESSFPLGPVLLGAGGVIMLGGAVAAGLLGRSRDAELKRFGATCGDPCAATDAQRRELERVERDAGTFYTLTTVLAVAGGVTLGSAAAWYFLSDSPSEPKSLVTLHFSPGGGAGAQFFLHY